MSPVNPVGGSGDRQVIGRVKGTIVARQRILPSTQRTLETAFHDINGEPVLTIALEEGTTVDPSGNVQEFKRNTNSQLVCGTMWNPGMLAGNAPILLGVCERCRHPPYSFFDPEQPTHGLCSQANGMLCPDCGAFTCPRHRRLGDDGQWRCLFCLDQQPLSGLLKSIFFKREDT